MDVRIAYNNVSDHGDIWYMKDSIYGFGSINPRGEVSIWSYDAIDTTEMGSVVVIEDVALRPVPKTNVSW